MDKEQVQLIIQKRMKKNCQITKPAFCKCSNSKCMKTACWFWEAKALTRQIAKLIDGEV